MDDSCGFEVYRKNSCEEDEIYGEQIERIFGGYYIVRDVKLSGCRTFPGQDRDTEYYYTTCIEDVIDENGVILSEEEKNKYLKQNPIKQTTEYGENIVECESSFHRLETYKYLFSIPKKLKPIGLYKGDRFRVGVVSDYRDFFVVVKNKIISFVYDDKQFKFIEKLLGIDFEEEQNSFPRPVNKYVKQLYEPVNKTPEENINVKEIEPEVTVVINDYLSIFSDSYNIYGHGATKVYDDKYGINRYIFHPHTCYYLVNDEWRMIKGYKAQKVYEKLNELESNRPNYIQEVISVADEIVLNGEKYSIFKFECRPYGFITKDGKFDYSFDVNNIQW